MEIVALVLVVAAAVGLTVPWTSWRPVLVACLAGLALAGVAALLAYSGPAGDANIGAGLLGLAGAAVVAFGVGAGLRGGIIRARRGPARP